MTLKLPTLRKILKLITVYSGTNTTVTTPATHQQQTLAILRNHLHPIWTCGQRERQKQRDQPKETHRHSHAGHNVYGEKY